MFTEYREVLPEGNIIYRVNTGGAIPEGADAVIMVEDTQVFSTHVGASGKMDEKQIEILAQVPPGENVRQPGSDVKAGDVVLEKGQVIHSAGGEIGTLAFVGRTKVKVTDCYISRCMTYCDAGQSPSKTCRCIAEHRK